MAVARGLLASRPSPETIAVALRFVVVIVFLAMFVFYVIPRQKTFTVSGVTDHVHVHAVTNGATDWSVVGLEICVPTVKPSERSVRVRDCAEDYYEGRSFPSLQTVRWTDDYALDIRVHDDDTLYIYVTRSTVDEDMEQPVTIGDLEITDGTSLFVPTGGAERLVLPVRGYMTLGEAPVQSTAQVLRNGSFEIRQSFWPLGERQVVTSGDFVPGDRVTYVRTRIPIWARLFTEKPPDEDRGRMPARIFVADLDAGSPGFDVVATTDLAYSDMLLTRVGGQPTVVPATAAQRLAADPLPVAAATGLGLLATLIALINNFFGKPGAATASRKR